MTMDLQVPLNRLKFGQEDGAGINARIVGRQDGIAELAANIHARGQIENLVVKACGEGFYSVSNGNRRLAAFHMIYSPDSSEPIRCTLRDVDEDGAFEDSLTTAVTAKQLHPVDQYEAFARLRDRHGKTNEEIAAHYGMTGREVEQALALGHLSPAIREAWRKGELKTEAARAFTLAADHKTQDDVLAALSQGRGGSSDVDDYDVKRALKISHDECGRLVAFIGFEAYAERGGKVTRDLFGTDHQVSDPKLVKKMAAEKLAEECEKLKTSGWSFAITADSVRNVRHDYTQLKVNGEPTDEERERLQAMNTIFSKGEVTEGHYYADDYAELTGPEQQAFSEYHRLKREIQLRAYTPKMMEKAGCFVGIDYDGFLEIEYGYVKPAKKEVAAEIVKAEKKEQKKAAAKTAASEGKPPPASTTMSNAQTQRLEAELIAATRDAIAAEPQLVNSPLFETLAKICCAQIIPDSPFRMPDALRTKLPSLRQTLNPGVFNTAIAKRFDADDYFNSAPKGLLIKALAEAVNPDEARKAVKAHPTSAGLRTFAQVNVMKTGWLPKELRSVHYKGPGSEGYKRPAAVADAPEKPVSTADNVRAAKAEREVKKNEVQMKRAAASKKSASKKSRR
jgi:ParB family chromosome partitioning protein